MSEPHINSTAVHELYTIIIYYGTSVTQNYIPSMHGSMNINEKYSIAHSHAWTMGCIYAVLL